ncbi:hypothetical protein [Streptomyces sp. NPDC059708]|uniref:hypothetical protein n=1 Tax=Streptomyces sp. NPDC059708 TaxID=3346916 RepID=UPI0036B1A018
MADEKLHQQLDEMQDELKRLREENTRIRRIKEAEAERQRPDGYNTPSYRRLKQDLADMGDY